MRRRDFLKTVPVAAGSVYFLPKTAFAKSARAAQPRSDWKTVELVARFDLKLPGPGRVWIPLPKTEPEYQILKSTHWSGDLESAGVSVDPKYGASILSAAWKTSGPRTFEIRHQIALRDRHSEKNFSPAAAALFSQPTSHVPTGGIVEKTASEIVARGDSADVKARKIYDWMVDHTLRDPKVRGCGTGDISTMLKTHNLKGKCADLSSLFVGLCRAAGVPAREVFGLRVLPSSWAPCLGKEGDVSSAQHCRAEYLSAANTWVPVDPADVAKLILEEKLDKKSARVREAREKLFGSWEMNWVAYNSARDFQLPESSDETVNYLMYPYLETGTKRNDGMEPAGFKYTLTSRRV